MMTCYGWTETGLEAIACPVLEPSAEALWIDMSHPTRAEDQAVEKALGIAIPTREDMLEIEPSSRLYTDEGVRYMTASVLCNSEQNTPKLAAITFILSQRHLVTVRYDNPRSFELFRNRAQRPDGVGNSAESVLVGLTDTIVDRIADILERITDEVDAVSNTVFASGQIGRGQPDDLRVQLNALGREGEMVAKSRESLVSVGRLLRFLTTNHGEMPLSEPSTLAITTQIRDIESLTAHCDSLAGRITFLLDAVLGLVGLQQNNIIKIFAVLSVVFMPPTLIASIYGMNFKQMPELDTAWGYPLALVGMFLAAVVPYGIFKWKKWL